MYEYSSELVQLIKAYDNSFLKGREKCEKKLIGYLRKIKDINIVVNFIAFDSNIVRLKAAQILAKLGEKKWETIIQGDDDDFAKLGKTEDPRLIEPFMEILTNTHYKSRLGAMLALSEYKYPFVVDLLIQFLEHWDGSFRKEAARILGEKHDLAAVTPLIELLGDVYPDVRKTAAQALHKLGEEKWESVIQGNNDDFSRLGETKDSRAVVSIINALKNGTLSIRVKAIEVLHEINDFRMVEPIIAMLNDIETQLFVFLHGREMGEYFKSWSIKEQLNAIQKLDLRAAKPLIELFEKAVQVLAKIKNPSTVDLLIELLLYSVEELKVAAAEALGEVKDSRAVDPLIMALGDEKWKVRKSAAVALGKIKDPRTLEPLIKALSDIDSEVRKSAVEALGELNDPCTVEPLIKTLTDKDFYVRKSAAEALGKLKDPRSIDPLIKAFGDINSDVRKSAAEALGKLKDPRSIDPLIKAFSDENKNVRNSATWLLGKIKDPRAVNRVIEALSDKNESIRINAAIVLGEIKDLRAVDPLIKAFGDKDWEVRDSAVAAIGKIKDPSAVNQLIEALNNKNELVRVCAVKALGELNDPCAVEPLIKTLTDKDSKVRESAASVLGDIKDSRAIDSLIKAISDKDKYVRSQAARALGNINNSRAIDSLIKALNDKDKYVCQVIVEVLGKFKDLKAVQPLITAFKETNVKEEQLRIEIAHSLISIAKANKNSNVLSTETRKLFNSKHHDYISHVDNDPECWPSSAKHHGTRHDDSVSTGLDIFDF